jgi:nucleoid-associated protein YgaU
MRNEKNKKRRDWTLYTNVVIAIMIALCIIKMVATSPFMIDAYNHAFNYESCYRNDKFHVVVVHTGDTLWSIASEWTDKGEDVREVMHRIVEENDLKTKHVYPGQTIIIPVNK